MQPARPLKCIGRTRRQHRACAAYRGPLVSWQISTLSGTAPAQELPPGQKIPLPGMTLQPPPAGITAASVTGPKRLLRPAPTAGKETSAADVNGITRLRYNHLPPFQHGQVQ
jgi:hypothetical protein